MDRPSSIVLTARAPAADLATVRRLLREVVEEAGRDFVYRTNPSPTANCYYIPLPRLRELATETPGYSWGALFNHKAPIELAGPDEGDPREITGCIVGRVLDKLGVMAHRTLRACAMDVMELHEAYPGIFTSDAVAVYLQMAQSTQDPGGTWGEAYDAAERWLITSGLVSAQ